MNERTKFYNEYYGQLNGPCNLKFLGVSEDGFPQFHVERLADGIPANDRNLYLELSQDEEGNGPGFLFIGTNKLETVS